MQTGLRLCLGRAVWIDSHGNYLPATSGQKTTTLPFTMLITLLIVDWAEVLCKCKKFLHFTGFVSLWPLSLTNSNFLTLWQLDCTVLVELQQCFLENFCPSSETQVREQALHMTKLGLYGFKMEQDASSKTIEQSLKNMLYRASYVGRVWADQVPLSQLVPMKRQAWADEFFT